MPDLLTAASAFSSALSSRAGVTFEERTSGLATVQIGNAPYAAFTERAQSSFGVVPPQSPRRAAHNGLSFVGIGPGNWLAVREKNPAALTQDLAQAFDGIASVSDQSSGYVVVRLSGPRARALLQAGLPIDLDPAVFSEESAAVSVIAHIGVIVWQNEAEVFEIAFFRSMADSFAHWLQTQTV
jgi:sarcosine oxidase subunit gamma